MKIIKLKDFALSGEFGPVKIGMTKKQVIDHLGTPEDEQDFHTGFTGLYYGWYEFFFFPNTGILDSIQNDHLQTDLSRHADIHFKNEKIEIDTWFMKHNEDLTRGEVKEILNAQEIPFTEEEYWGNDIIKFKSGVYLDFDNREGVWLMNDEGEVKQDSEGVIHDKDGFILNGIRFFPSAHS